MKLKNKKTGEIMEFDAILPVKDVKGGSVAHLEYGSLAQLNEEWEDYEEPKEYWFLSGRGEVKCIEDENTVFDKDHKSIGNYFETKEEAEKAVEKLKAWKRLKDKGFRFIPEASHVEQTKETGESMMFIACTMNDYRDFVFGDNADIKLLFGGEE
jgi:carbamate kinase